MNEPKTDLMVGVVDVVGVEMALELFKVSSSYKSPSANKKAYLALVPRLLNTYFIVLNNSPG